MLRNKIVIYQFKVEYNAQCTWFKTCDAGRMERPQNLLNCCSIFAAHYLFINLIEFLLIVASFYDTLLFYQFNWNSISCLICGVYRNTIRCEWNDLNIYLFFRFLSVSVQLCLRLLSIGHSCFEFLAFFRQRLLKLFNLCLHTSNATGAREPNERTSVVGLVTLVNPLMGTLKPQSNGPLYNNKTIAVAYLGFQ